MSETSTTTLEDLQALCAEYDALADTVADLEQQLKDAKARFNRLKMDVIPEMCMEVGLMALTLNNGTSIEVTANVDASITQANRVAAHQWLRDNGNEGLIKTEIHCPFDREESAEARELYADLSERFPNSFIEERVHPSTLKAFVREQLAAGAEIPMDLFGARSYNVAKINRG